MTMKISLALSALLLGSSVYAAELVFTEPDQLSAYGNLNPGGLAFKTKLIRMADGRLVTCYGDKVAGSHDVYDLKADAVRLSRDVWTRDCMPSPANAQCSNEDDWSTPVNVSRTASRTSISTRWQETDGVVNETAAPFYGDSGKPNIFNSGQYAVVTWVDKYCPGTEQRMVSYNERGGITVPFSCLWESHIDFSAETPTWTTSRITDGSRDAKSDANKGVSVGLTPDFKGNWLISWQEDPHGLQIGGGDGPGDGASGANVTHGTDVWYTYTEDLMQDGFNNVPVRISNNYTSDGAGGNTSPVFHPSAPDVEIIELERGNKGASRPNSAMVSNGPTGIATALITYEATKGADRLDSGKFIRYHEFPFNQPPASQGQYLNGEPGAIISDPNENSRRVRFVTQVKAGANGLKMGVFWRQGHPVEGGPGDIMVRLGFVDLDNPDSNGLRPEDMVPAVDPDARAIDYAAATLLENEPGNNISSNTIPWTPVDPTGTIPDLPVDNNLADLTDLNPYEDSRAHRAAIRGDDFHIGYSYAKDWAVATYTDMDNYNFWVRSYNSVDNNWTVAANLSNITDKGIHVKEPRLVGMPGNGPLCKDPTNPIDQEDCQDKEVLLVAWGVETNVYAHVGGAEEGDIFYTRTKDKGLTYTTPSVVLGLGTSNRFESQLRSTPAGNTIFTVWNESNNDVGSDISGISVSTEETVDAP